MCKSILLSTSVLLVALLCFSSVSDAQPRTGWFWLELNSEGNAVYNDGDGWDNGEGPWFYYPASGWWNEWWYNDPFDPQRWKLITGWVYVKPVEIPGWVEITVNYTNELYEEVQGHATQPPLPGYLPNPDDYIVRKSFYLNPALTGAETVLIFEEILEYNPEWVSIDVRGADVEIIGEIWHECLPPDSEEWGGVNFTVEEGAVGLPGTAVNVDPDNEDDVYVGGGGTNLLRLDGNLVAQLGLVAGDDIDAISYGDPSVTVNPSSYYGGEWEVEDNLYWHFSVDKFAWGLKPAGNPNDVSHEVNVGTQSISIPPNPMEALGDYFCTFYMIRGGNMLVGDEEQLGLKIAGVVTNPTDELNGLDLLAANVVYPESEFFQPGDFYFSLRTGSPSLTTYGVHQADILTPDGAGGIKIAQPGDGVLDWSGKYQDLGINPENDLDALFVDKYLGDNQGGVPFFSVRDRIQASPAPDANPGDILVPDGFYNSDGVADQFLKAVALGLQDLEYGQGVEIDDNLDALDVETRPIEPAVIPSSAIGDWHAAGPGGMPEVWVDFGWTGAEWGTFSKPYDSVTEASGAVAVGGTVFIKDAPASGVTNKNETPRITGNMKLKAWPGGAGVSIGK